MDDAETVRVDVFWCERQNGLRRVAHHIGMLGRPGVQTRRKRADEGGKFRCLLRRPHFRLRRDAGRPHPAIAVEVRIAVEFGATATRLGVESHQQLRVPLHLSVAVGVEEALVIGGKDVRDAVAIPKDFRAFRRRGGQRPVIGAGKKRQPEDDGETRAARESRREVLHGDTIHPRAFSRKWGLSPFMHVTLFVSE